MRNVLIVIDGMPGDKFYRVLDAKTKKEIAQLNTYEGFSNLKQVKKYLAKRGWKVVGKENNRPTASMWGWKA